VYTVYTCVQLMVVIGITLTCVGCAWLSVITYCRLNSMLVIISAVFLGTGSAILLVSSISMATEIIGSYSVSSFTLLLDSRISAVAQDSSSGNH